MILALDSLHSMTRWQHMAMNMLKTIRGSSLDVTTWTHVKETFYEIHRWHCTHIQMASIHFSSWCYFFILICWWEAGREGGRVRSATAIRTGIESKKKKNKFLRKNCCTSVVIQSFISPLEVALVSLQPNTAEPRRKYKVLMITKWTIITIVFFLKSLSMWRWARWQRSHRMGLNRVNVGWQAVTGRLSFWQHVDIMLWNLHHRKRGRALVKNLVKNVASTHKAQKKNKKKSVIRHQICHAKREMISSNLFWICRIFALF